MSIKTETLSNDFKNRININSQGLIRTKTTGLDNIRKAKVENDDCAILSMFLPFQSAEEENRRFRCALGPDDCLLGNWKLATPGRAIFSQNNLSYVLLTNKEEYL